MQPPCSSAMHAAAHLRRHVSPQDGWSYCPQTAGPIAPGLSSTGTSACCTGCSGAAAACMQRCTQQCSSCITDCTCASFKNGQQAAGPRPACLASLMLVYLMCPRAINRPMGRYHGVPCIMRLTFAVLLTAPQVAQFVVTCCARHINTTMPACCPCTRPKQEGDEVSCTTAR